MNGAQRMTLLTFLLVWLVVGCVQTAPGTLSGAEADRAGTHQGFEGELIVSAASDLIPAFEEIGQRFTAETGIPVSFNFGSSGLLAQQIAQGAPVDVYASANRIFVDELLAGGHVLADTVSLYGVGRITLWTRADSRLDIATLDDLTNPQITRIAIANPDHAPYGVAAREALQTVELWDELQPKLILGENIAATLQYVATGNVEVGIIALSLSIAVGGEGRWTLIPARLHNPINQTLAVIARTAHETEARLFAEYVNRETSRDIMRRYGFALPDEGGN